MKAVRENLPTEQNLGTGPGHLPLFGKRNHSLGINLASWTVVNALAFIGAWKGQIKEKTWEEAY